MSDDNKEITPKEAMIVSGKATVTLILSYLVWIKFLIPMYAGEELGSWHYAMMVMLFINYIVLRVDIMKNGVLMTPYMIAILVPFMPFWLIIRRGYVTIDMQEGPKNKQK